MTWLADIINKVTHKKNSQSQGFSSAYNNKPNSNGNWYYQYQKNQPASKMSSIRNAGGTTTRGNFFNNNNRSGGTLVRHNARAGGRRSKQLDTIGTGNYYVNTPTNTKYKFQNKQQAEKFVKNYNSNLNLYSKFQNAKNKMQMQKEINLNEALQRQKQQQIVNAYNDISKNHPYLKGAYRTTKTFKKTLGKGFGEWFGVGFGHISYNKKKGVYLKKNKYTKEVGTSIGEGLGEGVMDLWNAPKVYFASQYTKKRTSKKARRLIEKGNRVFNAQTPLYNHMTRTERGPLNLEAPSKAFLDISTVPKTKAQIKHPIASASGELAGNALVSVGIESGAGVATKATMPLARGLLEKNILKNTVISKASSRGNFVSYSKNYGSSKALFSRGKTQNIYTLNYKSRLLGNYKGVGTMKSDVFSHTLPKSNNIGLGLSKGTGNLIVKSNGGALSKSGVYSESHFTFNVNPSGVKTTEMELSPSLPSATRLTTEKAVGDYYKVTPMLEKYEVQSGDFYPKNSFIVKTKGSIKGLSMPKGEKIGIFKRNFASVGKVKPTGGAITKEIGGNIYTAREYNFLGYSGSGKIIKGKVSGVVKGTASGKFWNINLPEQGLKEATRKPPASFGGINSKTFSPKNTPSEFIPSPESYYNKGMGIGEAGMEKTNNFAPMIANVEGKEKASLMYEFKRDIMNNIYNGKTKSAVIPYAKISKAKTKVKPLKNKKVNYSFIPIKVKAEKSNFLPIIQKGKGRISPAVASSFGSRVRGTQFLGVAHKSGIAKVTTPTQRETPKVVTTSKAINPFINNYKMGKYTKTAATFPLMPKIGFGTGFGNNKRSKGWKKQKGFTPSIAAISLGMTSSKQKTGGFFSGIGLRYIPTKFGATARKQKKTKKRVTIKRKRKKKTKR